MIRIRRYLAVLALAGCAVEPTFDTAGIDVSLTPQQAAAGDEAFLGVSVIWGGVIIDSTNRQDTTQLEVLAYPLNANQKPDTAKSPLGRFLAQKAGYLETTDYAQGRAVTVSGPLEGTRTGRIGEIEYTYPLLAIDKIHLWPQRRSTSEPRFHFGIGVIFEN